MTTYSYTDTEAVARFRARRKAKRDPVVQKIVKEELERYWRDRNAKELQRAEHYIMVTRNSGVMMVPPVIIGG